MGCYLMVKNRLFLELNWRAEHGKGKQKCSKSILKIVKELETAK